LLLCSLLPAEAAESVGAIEHLGMGLEEAYERFGVPASVFPYRGAEVSHDDVVFYFADHVYLFWYADRVWQIRFDHRYRGDMIGFRMGDTEEAVIDALGVAYERAGDSLIFFLPDSSLTSAAHRGGFPLRLRAFFDADGLRDVYLYRGDF
jgi:hypothetical protein